MGLLYQSWVTFLKSQRDTPCNPKIWEVTEGWWLYPNAQTKYITNKQSHNKSISGRFSRECKTTHTTGIKTTAPHNGCQRSAAGAVLNKRLSELFF